MLLAPPRTAALSLQRMPQEHGAHSQCGSAAAHAHTHACTRAHESAHTHCHTTNKLMLFAASRLHTHAAVSSAQDQHTQQLRNARTLLSSDKPPGDGKVGAPVAWVSPVPARKGFSVRVVLHNFGHASRTTAQLALRTHASTHADVPTRTPHLQRWEGGAANQGDEFPARTHARCPTFRKPLPNLSLRPKHTHLATRGHCCCPPCTLKRRDLA